MLNIRLGMREDLIAIVDVGPGGARAAVVSHARDSTHVLVQTYSLISIENETAEHSVAAIGERVDDVCKRLLDRVAHLGIRGHIKTVYCVVHAPWTHSLTARKRVDYETETRITETHISGIAKDILSEIKGVDMSSMMEAAVIRTWLNGYPVTKPESKPAHSLVVCAVVSDCDPAVKKNTEAAIQRSFPNATVEWRSAARTIQTVLGSICRDDENYLSVDMGMDATQLISVRDGMPTGERVVPLGLRTILTRVDPKRVAEETLGLVRMLSRDACEGSACEAIRIAMASAEPEFAKIFGEALGALAADRRLANTLVLSANPDIVDWMKQFFSRLDFTQFTSTTLPFTVIPFDKTTPGTGVISDEDLHSQITFASALVNIEKGD